MLPELEVPMRTADVCANAYPPAAAAARQATARVAIGRIVVFTVVPSNGWRLTVMTLKFRPDRGPVRGGRMREEPKVDYASPGISAGARMRRAGQERTGSGAGGGKQLGLTR